LCARNVLLTAAFLALSASHASALERLEITPFGGWYIASDLYTYGGAQIGINNSVIYGGRVGLFPNARFGIEGSYSRAESDLSIQKTSLGFPSNTPLGSLLVEQWDGNLVFTQEHMGNPNATGFFTIGAGATNFSVDQRTASGDGTRSQFAWNFGIGTKIDMSEKIALRIDGRYRMTDTNISTDSGVYCDYYGYCYSYSSSWYGSGEISAGLSYRLK
jgi:opacity protein-like surface antigen